MLSVGGYALEIDQSATGECYRRRVAGPDQCGCVYCRNWIAGRDLLLPAEVRDLLQQTGVPSDGEIEVWRVPGDNQPHGYGGWYMAVGRIVSAPPEVSREFMLGSWRFSFSSRASYPVEAFAGQPTVEMHFFTWADNYIDDPALHVVSTAALAAIFGGIVLRVVDITTGERYQWGSASEGWHLLKRPELSVIQERVSPGDRERRHFHSKARQFFYVLHGQAILEVDGSRFDLGAGQGLEIPPGVPHQFMNESQSAVTFLVVSCPHSHGDRTNV